MNHRATWLVGLVWLGIAALFLSGCSGGTGGASSADLESVRTTLLHELNALEQQVTANRAQIDELAVALEQRPVAEPGDRPGSPSIGELEGAVASLEARVESLQTLADELEQTLSEMKPRGPGGRGG